MPLFISGKLPRRENIPSLYKQTGSRTSTPNGAPDMAVSASAPDAKKSTVSTCGKINHNRTKHGKPATTNGFTQTKLSGNAADAAHNSIGCAAAEAQCMSAISTIRNPMNRS